MCKAPRELPSKFVTSEIEIQLACRLLFIDMEGLNDGRALKMIVPQVNPRKMVSNYIGSAPLNYPVLTAPWVDYRPCSNGCS